MWKMAVEIRILHCWFWRWLQLATMVKCAAMGQSKDEAVYRRVIGLVEEVWPWLRYVSFLNFWKIVFGC